MENLKKTRIKKLESTRIEVENWGKRVLFWADWNRRVVRNDPLYEKILEEVEDVRHKAFNRYLKIINKVEVPYENYKLDIDKIRQLISN
jgi:hypothetical protein